MALVVVLFINATESKKNTSRTKTEVNKAETTVPCSAFCNHSTGVKTTTCDPENCKEVNCINKVGKCDPETCPMHKEGQPKEDRMCGSLTTCKGMCHFPETAESK